MGQFVLRDMLVQQLRQPKTISCDVSVLMPAALPLCQGRDGRAADTCCRRAARILLAESGRK
jgi:hypothetical protein